MDVRIGISQSPKELVVELPDDADQEKVVAEISAIFDGTKAMLWLSDRKGRRVGVPAAQLSYVEVSSETEGRRVGFGAQ